MTKKSNNAHGIKRRDFLAKASMIAVGFPLAARAAIAAESTRALAPAGAKVARVGIFPAIGLCRVGGSTEWFYAPEVPGLPSNGGKDYKSTDGRIKKQAQRFRVYAFDDEGRVIKEITDSARSKIKWSVRVANTKGAWYGFNNPMDNGDNAPGLPGMKRNQFFVTDEERERMLVIDSGVHKIHGKSVNTGGDEELHQMGGRFWDKQDVGLGHLQTDDAGRLIVFPPDGVSQSAIPNNPISSFADNDGWHDDWCDGPVHAEVEIDGETYTADPSWVASVGPNFAPEIAPISTLYDVIDNMNWQEGWSNPDLSGKVSFAKYIYPTFRRAALMEWVGSAANLREGWLKIADFSDPKFIKRLTDASRKNAAWREQVFEQFRDPYNLSEDAYKTEADKIPYMLGDGVNYSGSPLQWFQFPKLQYEYLKKWRDGEFVDDLKPAKGKPITSIDQVPLADQPHALTEAALEPCSGGAFHPGVELTYYLRHKTMYARNYDENQDLFRLAQRERKDLVMDLGRLLTPEILMNGFEGVPSPITHQAAGDLTRWMGLPWQCDAFSCQDVLTQPDFPTAVWWPALLPVDVLPEEFYDQMVRTDIPEPEQVKFFNTREGWKRGVAGIGYHADASYWDGLSRMIYLWERMGFVVRREWPKGSKRPQDIPREIFVETERGNMELRFDWTPADGVLPNPPQ